MNTSEEEEIFDDESNINYLFTYKINGVNSLFVPYEKFFYPIKDIFLIFLNMID